MMTLRAAALFGLLAISATRLTTCRSPGETTEGPTPGRPEPKDVNLAGVDTSAFTSREKGEWSSLVSELLAPCPDQPVTLAQCVQESRPCRACLPAARFLVDQVKQGRTRTQAESAFRARFSPDKVRNIELNDSPSKGAPDAPVVIVEWADFECPFCGAVKPVLDNKLEKYAGKVRVVFKHFPLPMHQNAEKAARSAVAAQRQNKFWEMHGELFANQQALDPGNVERMAQKIGLNLEQFKKDRDSEATADIVARDRKQGEALDIQGTPSIFINGRLFPSSQDFERDLDEWIALEIELTTGSSAKGEKAAAPAPSAASATPESSAAPAPSGGTAPLPSGAPSNPAPSAAPSGKAKTP
jgi:predicted DsbA family dithiol-disulfide isomerase